MTKKKPNKKGEKAQIEIAGLLIIVVLVSLILLFVLSFNAKREIEKEQPNQEIKDSNIREGFGSVLLETTTSCESRVVRELLTDCATLKEINCGSKTSCQSANETIEFILNETLKKIGYSYILSVKKDSNHIALFNDTGCKGNGARFVPAITQFITKYGTMSMIITQCS